MSFFTEVAKKFYFSNNSLSQWSLKEPLTFQHPPPSREIIVFIYHDFENDRKISAKQTQTFLVWEPSVLLFVPRFPHYLCVETGFLAICTYAKLREIHRIYSNAHPAPSVCYIWSHIRPVLMDQAKCTAKICGVLFKVGIGTPLRGS